MRGGAGGAGLREMTSSSNLALLCAFNCRVLKTSPGGSPLEGPRARRRSIGRFVVDLVGEGRWPGPSHVFVEKAIEVVALRFLPRLGFALFRSRRGLDDWRSAEARRGMVARDLSYREGRRSPRWRVSWMRPPGPRPHLVVRRARWCARGRTATRRRGSCTGDDPHAPGYLGRWPLVGQGPRCDRGARFKKARVLGWFSYFSLFFFARFAAAESRDGLSSTCQAS